MIKSYTKPYIYVVEDSFCEPALPVLALVDDIFFVFIVFSRLRISHTSRLVASAFDK